MADKALIIKEIADALLEGTKEYASITILVQGYH